MGLSIFEALVRAELVRASILGKFPSRLAKARFSFDKQRNQAPLSRPVYHGTDFPALEKAKEKVAGGCTSWVFGL